MGVRFFGAKNFLLALWVSAFFCGRQCFLHFFSIDKSSANAKTPYLASNVAKPKVKGIDGEFFQLWII